MAGIRSIAHREFNAPGALNGPARRHTSDALPLDSTVITPGEHDMSSNTPNQLVPFIVASMTSVALIGATSAYAGAPRYPDIVEQISHLQIQNEHQREMLRFSTTHINIGNGPLQIRGGGQVAPCVIDGTAYDQCTYATREVLDASGNIVYSQPAGVAFFH